MDKVKTINSLMAHLRNHHGIKINGSSQKRQLRNIGYYHGYKGYRYINNPENKIKFIDFNHIVALNKFDMDLKSLFYPLIIFVETALKNYVLEVIICEGGSAHFQDIYGALITDYRKHKLGRLVIKKHIDEGWICIIQFIARWPSIMDWVNQWFSIFTIRI